ncbi:MAG: helix-turn-helix domain-containing protein [Blastocatellia bacterium]|nr:helix-turn-helix domain-containing protein [Blastocatellia bacterium]
MRLHALHEKRIRAHAILLSDRQYSLDQIADIYQVDRQVVSQWLGNWNDLLFEGLGDDPKAYPIRERGLSERLPPTIIGGIPGTGFRVPQPDISSPRHGIGGAIPDPSGIPAPSSKSSRDDRDQDEQKTAKLRLQISRFTPATGIPELQERKLDLLERMRKRDERPPEIITLPDKPGKYTAHDIIEYFDNLPYVIPYSFVDLEHPYFYTANSRLTLFADETRWAMAFEKSGYTPRGHRIELELNYFGNCLENLTPIPNSDVYNNLQFLTLIDGGELNQIGLDENNFTEADLAAGGGNKKVMLRGQYVEIPVTMRGYVKWVPDILTREYPERIDYRDLARYIAYEYEEHCRATEEELRGHIPRDLPKLMVIDEWHHKTYNVYQGNVLGDPPSSYETYRLIAEVLETKDPAKFRPTLSPNNHWINWPYAGSL